MSASILVAGIGNIFLGDDGFGPEVMRHVGAGLDGIGVRGVDYGIRGMHLAYDLLDGWDALVLVDAIPDQGSPGRLRVFEADHESGFLPTGLDAHAMDPGAVFASLRALGGSPPRTVVVGCEVAEISARIGLSAPVAAAVPEALRAVRRAVAMLKGAAPCV
ncbi:peptidase M52 [Mycolicibacterium duvalii]|uniref:Peptidase M52 n=1 Tax=Mycolicibacterium duvalii TaxID=39688 RepID=A0A7I7K8D5_9MYCO|nr:hydrogenase maturation protease [Mycolicibacterium duvalii]MCV7368117.1 hydrogenase maturation protease [Mycolicibacterium duvalii]PEG43391.1 peptidase M52 [Mycolicibacterium duvalii]BBX19768.1 peptidase M52 [Mycolicibacterium duvalii]